MYNTNKKVAVVGSGPAGITVADNLLKHGVQVTIYESFYMAGGVLINGIPDSRLPKSVVKKEIDALLDKGCKLVLNTKVGRDIKLSQLQQDYDAVFVGAGAGVANFIGLQGEDLDRVYTGHDYIARFKTADAYPKESLDKLVQGKSVVVLGAGNVAMDAARTAFEAGAKSVIVAYRRSQQEMPAREYEVEDAKEMGTVFKFLHNPKKLLGKDGKVTGIEFVQTQLGEPDQQGRRRPIDIPDSNFIMSCDTVIECIGAGVDPQLTDNTGLDLDKNGLILVDDKCKTNLDNVYAGGDIVTGNKIVPLAMSAGRKAAKSILERFGIVAQPMEKGLQEVMLCISPKKK